MDGHPRSPAEMLDIRMEDHPGSPFQSANVSLIGLHHVNEEIPCQDNSWCHSGEDFSIAVVSDGHSDRHCFRSDIGSTVAVGVTVERLRSRFTDGGLAGFLGDAEYDPEGQFDLLWKEIVIAWKMRIREYDNLHPVTEGETELLRTRISRRIQDPAAVDAELERILNGPAFLRYGCTLRIAVQHRDGYMLMSLGDGESIVVGMDGRSSSPLPRDEDTVGSETHSICEDNPYPHCRYVLGTEPVLGLAVCSDGIHCADEPVDNAYYTGEFVKRTFSSMSGEDWFGEFSDNVDSFTREFPKDDCSVAFTVLRDRSGAVTDTAVTPLEWADDPVSCSISERSLRGRREFGYMFNVFDETCYRGPEGIAVMQPLVARFCNDVVAEIRNAEDRGEAFVSNLRLMLQKWNRSAMDHDDAHPDTPEQNMARLTNGIAITNRSQKYGLSLALAVTVDGVVYSALVGRGRMTVSARDGERILEYENPESTAHVNFRAIIHSADDAVRVSVSGMDGSGEETVLVNRRGGFL
ncbi:MAG: protein phosphatase 2C domain-containing protein [Candidatus Methanomethylophilaceae archaeon]|nr:protein phosphatase 2C domain-containing protein [Candidatus Methanomethylophilaceae archaeon]